MGQRVAGLGTGGFLLRRSIGCTCNTPICSRERMLGAGHTEGADWPVQRMRWPCEAVRTDGFLSARGREAWGDGSMDEVLA